MRGKSKLGPASDAFEHRNLLESVLGRGRVVQPGVVCQWVIRLMGFSSRPCLICAIRLVWLLALPTLLEHRMRVWRCVYSSRRLDDGQAGGFIYSDCNCSSVLPASHR